MMLICFFFILFSHQNVDGNCGNCGCSSPFYLFHTDKDAPFAPEEVDLEMLSCS